MDKTKDFINTSSLTYLHTTAPLGLAKGKLLHAPPLRSTQTSTPPRAILQLPKYFSRQKSLKIPKGSFPTKQVNNHLHKA